jgi:hypothetical protein
MHSPPEQPKSEQDVRPAAEVEPGESPEPVDVPEPVDFEAVARISTQATVKSVRVSFLHADIVDASSFPSDWHSDAVTGFNAGARLDRDKQELHVTCLFMAMYVPGFDPEAATLPSPRDAPWELHVRFELAYDLNDPSTIQEDDPEHFAVANGLLHAWPYWREIAQSTSVRMGLTPLVIGSFKIPWSGDPEPHDEGATHEGHPPPRQAESDATRN